MKVKLISDTDLPGAYSICAESQEEVLILRMFCNDIRPIGIASHGGNIREGSYSMLIKHYGLITDIKSS